MAGYRSAGGSKLPIGAIGPAVIAAGPIFVTSLVLAGYYLQLPRAVAVSAGELLVFALILVPAAIIGGLVSLVPILLLATLLYRAGETFAEVRSSPAWIATGAAAGAALTLSFGLGANNGEPVFAIVATSTICAALVHRRLYRSATLHSTLAGASL